MKNKNKLRVNEIYYSIQGESTHMGRPCIFIRLTYCNLRCSYCDSEYAFYDGQDMSIEAIINKIKTWNCNLIEVTGGEPLVQKECIILLHELIKNSYEVMLETSGSLAIDKVPESVIKIIDFKCPSSKMESKNRWSIISDINEHDEIKFVIGDKGDYKWAKAMISLYQLDKICTILFSPVYDKIEPKILSNWILEDNLPVRMQLQLHKILWEPEARGV